MRKIEYLRNKANSLPTLPGVYIMKDKNGVIIYIGKAKALKNRVSQYFGSQEKHYTKVRKMVENVEDFDYILTDSEFEALVLCVHGGGQIPVAGVGKQNNDVFACVFRAFCQKHRGVQRRTGGDAAENAFRGCQIPGG